MKDLLGKYEVANKQPELMNNILEIISERKLNNYVPNFEDILSSEHLASMLIDLILSSRINKLNLPYHLVSFCSTKERLYRRRLIKRAESSDETYGKI